mmetsp:Transcript_3381/g.4123  ORF Transcript_3381/g.4123 Transcript_3381/m.4123 type:complete len:172 (-) Transcript_3381:695-1210(-)
MEDTNNSKSSRILPANSFPEGKIIEPTHPKYHMPAVNQSEVAAAIAAAKEAERKAAISYQYGASDIPPYTNIVKSTVVTAPPLPPAIPTGMIPSPNAFNPTEQMPAFPMSFQPNITMTMPNISCSVPLYIDSSYGLGYVPTWSYPLHPTTPVLVPQSAASAAGADCGTSLQ